MIEVNVEIIRTQRCAAAFQSMFWAFVFFLDFRLGVNNVHVDVLPDLIGWFMIASALTSILDLSRVVPTLRTLSYWLLFLSLFDVIEIRIPMTQSGNVTTWISPTFFLSTISTILDILLIWKLCGLIMAMAATVDGATIWRRADFRRKLYVSCAVLLSIAVLISFAVPPFVLVAVVVGLPVSIIVFCLMMGLMSGTARMCRGAIA